MSSLVSSSQLVIFFENSHWFQKTLCCVTGVVIARITRDWEVSLKRFKWYSIQVNQHPEAPIMKITVVWSHNFSSTFAKEAFSQFPGRVMRASLPFLPTFLLPRASDRLVVALFPEKKGEWGRLGASLMRNMTSSRNSLFLSPALANGSIVLWWARGTGKLRPICLGASDFSWNVDGRGRYLISRRLGRNDSQYAAWSVTNESQLLPRFKSLSDITQFTVPHQKFKSKCPQTLRDDRVAGLRFYGLQ